ncbi:IcmP (DotM) [Pseudomonas fluorescens]|uniref:secretion/conjugation apparatus DotM-related subunit n=1 Tax=Pseudomonas TaxID=286 RepID=UPI000F029202|nr:MULTISPECIES: IcmP (DotM) [Pseudomonas]MBD8089339.1 IcmP (DotM) [Pseudomonas fluorescens]MBD8615234.1 IcmP (DotM) [Pseudomonas putida]MBD8682112.1 IcmP (DotM) [Pseudomonas sp. CFBP 13719]
MSQRGGGASDTNMEMWAFLIVIIFIIIFWLISENFWMYATAWKWLRIAELSVFAYTVPQVVENWSGIDFGAGMQFLMETNPKLLTAAMISDFDNIYVKFFNWLPGGLIAVAGAKLFLAAENVSNKFDMESLLIKMSRAFPHNRQFLGIHPEETPIDFYPDDPASYEYSMVMTERQFAQCVPPVGLLEPAKRDKSLRKPIWDGEKSFDDELARKAFDTQLGGLYMGYNRLDEDEKQLTDLFRNKILIKRKEVLPVLMDYVSQIMKDRRDKKVFPDEAKLSARVNLATLEKAEVKLLANFPSHHALIQQLTTVVDGWLQKGGAKIKIKESQIRTLVTNKDLKTTLRHVMADDRLSRHAFTSTGLMTLLEAAREGATLAPSSFRWLKVKNRPLWYALNCVGKKTAFTESAGTYGHWLLETEIKMGVPHAETTEAIEALRVALGLTARGSEAKQDDDWG